MSPAAASAHSAASAVSGRGQPTGGACHPATSGATAAPPKPGEAVVETGEAWEAGVRASILVCGRVLAPRAPGGVLLISRSVDAATGSRRAGSSLRGVPICVDFKNHHAMVIFCVTGPRTTTSSDRADSGRS